MEIINCKQGTDEWWEAKLGRVSASNFSKVLNKKTGRKAYMLKVAAERLSGVREETYTNQNMENGKILEASAREYYEKKKQCKVDHVGFVIKDEWVGVSPDGLVGVDGDLEIKCPLPSTHIKYIISGCLPAVYVPQVQGQLWVTERKWCDFVSYCPLIKGNPFFCIRVPRDESYIALLEKEVEVFVSELKSMIEIIAF